MVISDLNYLEVVSDATCIQGGRRWRLLYRLRQRRLASIAYTSGNGTAQTSSYSYSSSTDNNGVTTSEYYSSESSSYS
jgi:hypothetical protein